MPRLVQNVVKSKPLVSEKILGWSREAIEAGKPHFRVGGNEQYFPTARLILLRPNAKHTPYQAKFIVPKSFNKLDLRDYLFHVYGLRALNVTTQLLHGRYFRENQITPRYRQAQVKKMTIDMAEPFIWPEEPESKEPWSGELVGELKKYREEQQRLGSDAFKPGTAFDGALGPYQPQAEPFIPKFLKKQLHGSKQRAAAGNLKAETEQRILKQLQ